MKKRPKVKDQMRQRSLAIDERSLFEKLCDQVNLIAGFKAVKKNGGSPGVDGVTVEDFSNCLDEELAQLKTDLESWSYNGRWVLSRTFALHRAYPNRWFIDQFGQRIRSNDKLKHWFPLSQWVKVT